MLISVIVSYFNDGDIIYDSVGRLLGIPNTEIILIDDGSYVPLSPAVAVPDNVRIIRQSRNLGVGSAFDRGVREARGGTTLLMGCDVMVEEGWDTHVRRLAAEHPKGIIAAACVGVTKDNDYKFVNPPRAGAEIRLRQPAQSRDKWFAERNYNDILVGAWLDPAPTAFTKCGCLMGAAYVVNKRWYTHIGGFLKPKMADVWLSRQAAEAKVKIMAVRHTAEYLTYIPPENPIWNQKCDVEFQTGVINEMLKH